MRSSFLTVCSVAHAAYASCDMIHEVMGHGVARRRGAQSHKSAASRTGETGQLPADGESMAWMG
jgi:hypothetical protein